MQGNSGTFFLSRTHSTASPLHLDQFLWCNKHYLTYSWCAFLESTCQSVIKRDSYCT